MKKKTEKLYSILIDFGFIKTETYNHIFFRNGREVFAYPKYELQDYHFITSRKQLHENGWIDKKEFNKLFNL